MGKKFWTVILLLSVALTARLVFLVGLTGSDDLQYASEARKWAQGEVVPAKYFAGLRVGVVAPTALMYRLFGVSVGTTAATPLMLSMLGVLAAFLLGDELFGFEGGVWAGGLYAVFPLDVVQAGILIPDVAVASLTGLAFWCVLRGERARHRWGMMFLALAAGALCGLGHLCKMTALMPVGFLLIYTLTGRRRWPLFPGILVGCLAVMVSEGIVYLAATGDFLYRYKVTGGWDHALSDGRLSGQLTSLWEYPRAMFLSLEESGLFWYLLLAAGVWAVIVRPRRVWPALLWVIVLGLCLQFGFTGIFRGHYPVHMPRYLTLIALPAAALIGAFLTRLRQRVPWISWPVAVIVLTSSLLFTSLHATLEESLAWNARRAAESLRGLADRPVYVATRRDLVTLDFLLDGKRDPGPDEGRDLRPLFRKHDDFSGVDSDPTPADELSDSYVVVDWRRVRFEQERHELTLPVYLVTPPGDWERVLVIRNDFSALRYWPLRAVVWMLDRGLVPGPAGRRLRRTLDGVMTDNECVIYEVPGAGSRT